MPRQRPETPEEKRERVRAMHKHHQSVHERQLEMLRLIQCNGGLSIEKLAEKLHVSETVVKQYRRKLREGEVYLETYVQLEDGDIGRGGVMPTTAHPLVLVANSSEVYALLTALLEFSARNQHTDMGDIADWLAGEIHYQLTDHCKQCVDPALEGAGLAAPVDREPMFHREEGDNVDEKCPYYYRTMLQKQNARVRITYAVDDGGEEVAVVGRICWRQENPEMLALETADGRVDVPRAKITSTIKLKDSTA
ncbi:winged helix-turn-helix domain-containing protein [Paratractidigestivibacter sp.]|uniref:winged helix-turn-helix domain-containing protein n=1 Tax=Paratractidigestivibacter sp. TaxID=2847316 RepID=UPI002ACB0AB8|nr:winged helix-turn-helix domain-containing protein [Paratractidigestivibacter sp.]